MISSAVAWYFLLIVGTGVHTAGPFQTAPQCELIRAQITSGVKTSCWIYDPNFLTYQQGTPINPYMPLDK